MEKNSSNFQQVLWLSIGQLSSFALAFVSAAILSRYFDKTEYGTYKQILFVYITLQTIFTVGLPGVFSYFIPRLNCGQQKAFINGLNKIFFILGALFSLFLFLLSSPIAKFLNNPELAIGLKLFSPFPLLTFPAMGVEGIYTALRKSKYIAYYNVFSKVVMLLCIVLPVIFFNSSYKGAIIGWGGASFLTFLLAMYMKNRPYTLTKKELIPNMYKTVFSYSLPLMGASVAGFFVNSADQLFISKYYGTEVFAVYSNGAMSVPIIGMVIGSVKNVLLPLFSKAQLEGKMEGAMLTYNNAVERAVILIFPVLLFVIFFAVDIVKFIYGEQYADSGIFLRYHVIRDFVDVFPFFAILMALGLSSVYMYIHIFGIVFIYILDFCVVKIGLSPIMVVVVSSLWAILLRGYIFYYIYKKAKLNLINSYLIRRIGIVILNCVICLACLLVLKYIVFINFNSLMILMISGVLFYLLLYLSGKLIGINYLEALSFLLKKK